MVAMAAGVVGCKKTYKDPTAFLEKYLIEDFLNQKNPPAMVKALKLKGPELLDVRMGVKGVFNAAIGTVRYVPMSPDTVYVMRYDHKGKAYSPVDKVLSKAALDKELQNEVGVARVESDTGEFVPVDKVSGSNVSYTSLDWLEILDVDGIAQGMRNVAAKVIGMQKIDLDFSRAVDAYAKYATNGQLDYVTDKEAIQRFTDAFVHIMDMAASNPNEFKYRIDKKRLFELGSIEPKLRKLGGEFKPSGAPQQKIPSVREAATLGRLVFQGITAGNVSRYAMGSPGLWPHLSEDDGLSDDAEDVAGKMFKTSTDYFKALIIQNGKSKNPFVGLDPRCLNLSASSEALHCDWIVLAGMTDEMHDDIPVLISANVDYSRLPFTTHVRKLANENIPIGESAGRPGIAWGNDYVVVVRKSGRVEVIKASDFTASRLLGGSVAQFTVTVTEGNKTPRYLDVNLPN